MSEPDKKTLTGKSIAQHRMETSLDNLLSGLPDPDPVLAKLPDRGDSMLADVDTDGIAFSLIQTRKSATLSREARIEPGGKDTPSRASKRLAQAFAEDLERVDMHSVMDQILDAPLWGMVPLELVWDVRGGMLRLSAIHALPRSWFAFGAGGDLQICSDLGQMEPVPAGKVVLARVGHSLVNPYGKRALTRCLWPVAFKRGGIKAWLKLAEDLNLPLMLGTYQAGTSPEEQATLLTSMAQARQSGVLITPEGIKIEIKEGSGRSAGASLHDKLQDRMDKVLARVITGQTLSHDIGQSGSRAASQTHYQVMDDLRQSDQALIRSVFTEIARLYRDVNDSAADPPRLVWFEEEDPQTEWAARDRVLASMGVGFSKSYLMAKYGLKDGDFELRAAEEEKSNPSPLEAPNSGNFTEEDQPLDELAGSLPQVAQWAVGVEDQTEQELLGLALDQVNQAQGFGDLVALLMQLLAQGTPEPLALAMITAKRQGQKETGGDHA